MVGLVVATALPAGAETQRDAGDVIGVAVPAPANRPEPFPKFAGLNYRLEVPLRRDRAARDALVFEYGAPWRFGDSFLFLKATELLVRDTGDVADSPRPLSGVYAEWHPRVRLSYVIGRRAPLGPVTEVAFASQVTVSGSGTRTHAHGVGVDLAVPTAYFARANAYLRNDPGYAGTSFKALYVSLHAFEVAGLAFRGTVWIEGHTAEGTEAADIQLQVHLHVDLGAALFRAPDHLYGGVIVDAERAWLPGGSSNDFTAQLAVRWRS